MIFQLFWLLFRYPDPQFSVDPDPGNKKGGSGSWQLKKRIQILATERVDQDPGN